MTAGAGASGRGDTEERPPVRYEAGGGRATITLDRPHRRNATTTHLYEELLAAARLAEADDEVRCVVLTGAGTVFSAGQDRAESASLDQAGYARYDAANRAAREYFAEMSKPVICRVNGPAVGGACVMALADCDITIASDAARFALKEVNSGLPGPSFLLYTVGRARALFMALTGSWVDAATAADWGLIYRAVPADELDQAVDAVVAAVVELPPLAVAATKQQMRFAVRRMGLPDVADFGVVQEKVLNMTADREEAQHAFLGKREAAFRGD